MAQRVGGGPPEKPSSSQKAFWQAITVGDISAVKVLLKHRDINVNMSDSDGDQRQGCTALHLAILEMPTWKGSEGRNGIQTSAFVESFFSLLLDHGADCESVCSYRGEWYLQTAAGKTKSFYPEGYDSIGLVLQFVEITRGASEVIAHNVTRRLELIRDILLRNVEASADGVGTPSNDDDNDDCVHGNTESFPQACFPQLQQEKFTDVELRCDGQTFKAHKVVLAARSPVFDAMFTVPCSESLKPVALVEIEEADPMALKAFINFLYTSTIEEKDMELTPDLLVLANRYDVDSLKQRCTAALTGNLSVENAAQVLGIADSSGANDLKEQVLRFVSQNAIAVVETNDFKQLSPELMYDAVRAIVHCTSSSSSAYENNSTHGTGSSSSSSSSSSYGRNNSNRLKRSRHNNNNSNSRVGSAENNPKHHCNITNTTTTMMRSPNNNNFSTSTAAAAAGQSN